MPALPVSCSMNASAQSKDEMPWTQTHSCYLVPSPGSDQEDEQPTRPSSNLKRPRRRSERIESESSESLRKSLNFRPFQASLESQVLCSGLGGRQSVRASRAEARTLDAASWSGRELGPLSLKQWPLAAKVGHRSCKLTLQEKARSKIRLPGFFVKYSGSTVAQRRWFAATTNLRHQGISSVILSVNIHRQRRIKEVKQRTCSHGKTRLAQNWP